MTLSDCPGSATTTGRAPDSGRTTSTSTTSWPWASSSIRHRYRWARARWPSDCPAGSCATRGSDDPMDLDDLRRIGGAATRSAFRLETLPQYLVPQEEVRFTAWKAGVAPPRRTPENDAAMARLQSDLRRGLRRYRVHILDQPLTPYLRFELYLYLDSVAVGNEISVADRDAHPELADLREDFWMFDDETVVRMFYDEEGHFLRPELAEDIEPYRAMRDVALRHSEPLLDYMARTGLTEEALTMTG